MPTSICINKSVCSYLRTLTTWHRPHSPRHATAVAIDRSCPPGPQQQTWSSGLLCAPMMGQTYGWTPGPGPFRDHVLQTMRAVLMNDALHCLSPLSKSKAQLVSSKSV